MSKHHINGNDLRTIGYPEGRAIGTAMRIAEKHYRKGTRDEVLGILTSVFLSPTDYLEDPILAPIAEQLIEKPKNDPAGPEIPLRAEQGATRWTLRSVFRFPLPVL
jgi:tRNA-splicing ligase RtcB